MTLTVVGELVTDTCNECRNEFNCCPLEDFDIECPLQRFINKCL